MYLVNLFLLFLENLEKWNAPRFCARPGSQPDTFLAFSGVSIPQQKSASANKIGNCTNNIWFFVDLLVCVWLCVCLCCLKFAVLLSTDVCVCLLFNGVSFLFGSNLWGTKGIRVSYNISALFSFRFVFEIFLLI